MPVELITSKEGPNITLIYTVRAYILIGALIIASVCFFCDSFK